MKGSSIKGSCQQLKITRPPKSSLLDTTHVRSTPRRIALRLRRSLRSPGSNARCPTPGGTGRLVRSSIWFQPGGEDLTAFVADRPHSARAEPETRSYRPRFNGEHSPVTHVRRGLPSGRVQPDLTPGSGKAASARSSFEPLSSPDGGSSPISPGGFAPTPSPGSPPPSKVSSEHLFQLKRFLVLEPVVRRLRQLGRHRLEGDDRLPTAARNFALIPALDFRTVA